MDIEVHKDCLHGQWKNCDFVLHIGTTAYVFFRDGRSPNRSATVVEIFTHKRWFRFRRGVPALSAAGDEDRRA